MAFIDSINLTHTEGIESQKNIKTQFNLRDASIKWKLLKNDDIFYNKIKYDYDGLNYFVKQTDYFRRTTEHRLNRFDRVIESTWPNDRVINIRYVKFVFHQFLLLFSRFALNVFFSFLFFFCKIGKSN